MGVDLQGKHGDIRFNWSAWSECLRYALDFGWSPEGTTDPIGDPSKWKGGYDSNDGQLVSDRDARALGEALLRAIDALLAGKITAPREDDPFDPSVMKALCEAGIVEGKPDAPPNKSLAQCLGMLADYAVIGGFRIY